MLKNIIRRCIIVLLNESWRESSLNLRFWWSGNRFCNLVTCFVGQGIPDTSHTRGYLQGAQEAGRTQPQTDVRGVRTRERPHAKVGHFYWWCIREIWKKSKNWSFDKYSMDLNKSCYVCVFCGGCFLFVKIFRILYKVDQVIF